MKKFITIFAVITCVLPNLTFWRCSNKAFIEPMENNNVLLTDAEGKTLGIMQFCALNKVPLAAQQMMSTEELALFKKLSKYYHINYAFLNSDRYKENKEGFLCSLEDNYLKADAINTKKGEYLLVFNASYNELGSELVVRPELVSNYMKYSGIKLLDVETYDAKEAVVFDFFVYKDSAYSLSNYDIGKLPDPTRCKFDVNIAVSEGNAGWVDMKENPAFDVVSEAGKYYYVHPGNSEDTIIYPVKKHTNTILLTDYKKNGVPLTSLLIY